MPFPHISRLRGRYDLLAFEAGIPDDPSRFTIDYGEGDSVVTIVGRWDPGNGLSVVVSQGDEPVGVGEVLLHLPGATPAPRATLDRDGWAFLRSGSRLQGGAVEVRVIEPAQVMFGGAPAPPVSSPEARTRFHGAPGLTPAGPPNIHGSERVSELLGVRRRGSRGAVDFDLRELRWVDEPEPEGIVADLVNELRGLGGDNDGRRRWELTRTMWDQLSRPSADVGAVLPWLVHVARGASSAIRPALIETVGVAAAREADSDRARAAVSYLVQLAYGPPSEGEPEVQRAALAGVAEIRGVGTDAAQQVLREFLQLVGLEGEDHRDEEPDAGDLTWPFIGIHTTYDLAGRDCALTLEAEPSEHVLAVVLVGSPAASPLKMKGSKGSRQFVGEADCLLMPMLTEEAEPGMHVSEVPSSPSDPTRPRYLPDWGVAVEVADLHVSAGTRVVASIGVSDDEGQRCWARLAEDPSCPVWLAETIREARRRYRYNINPDEPIAPPSACALCGAAPVDPIAVLTWTLEVDDDDHRWICLECTRTHARDIEGRLTAQDWMGLP